MVIAINQSLIFSLIVISLSILSLKGHIFHGSYLWEYSKPVFYLFWRLYMRFEYGVMKMIYQLGKSPIFKHLRFLREFFTKILSFIGNGEVYTLNECYHIIDALYKEYPNVYVAIRVCPCRQAMEIYDTQISNITDLTFVFSKTPGKKKRMEYTTFISLEKAKKLLRKFDREGFVHAMFGGCAKFIDGSINLAICNCMRRRDGKGSGCIPMTLATEYGTFKYEKPHNIAKIDQDKCQGFKNCGECIEYCNFEARVLEPRNGKIKIIEERCLGCGLCVSHCSEGANAIQFVPENKVQFYQNLFKNIQIKQKNLQQF